MKKLTKLFSLLTVLVTILGPLGNIRHLVHADDAQPQQTKVFVHKILLNKEQFADFDHEAKKDGYNGNRIGTITDYFGSSAKDIGGVTFKVYKQVADTENGEGVVTGNSLLGLENSAPNSDTKKYKLHTDSNKASITTVENTGAEVVLENGIYIFVEDKEHSPYYNKQEGDTKGSELTEAKAVPFKLELPVTKPDGTGYFDNDRNPLHVYPKNTEDKPTVTKKFADTEERLKNVEIGEEIPYKITTEIPKGSSYKTIVWEDLMVAGLDFVTNSLTITSEQLGEDKKLEVTNHYTLTQDKRGFLLKLNEAGLAAIEEVAKTQAITITLNYKATLNDSAIVDAEIPNKVRFHYGNRPRTFQDENPKPVTPDPNGNKIVVNKTWGNAVGPHPEVKFDIYEQETGKKVGTVTLPANQTSAEYSTDLKAGVQYIVIEQPVSGFLPSYTVNGNGVVTVTNNPSDNPPPLTPDKPEVITHGKRFIKTDDKEADEQGIEKLLGAEFVVKNQENKYLALKNAQTQQEQLNKYKQAEEAYRAAVKAKNEVDTKKAERDAAYEALNMQWEWVNDKSHAFTFISSTDGKFEVKGLKQGTYYLEETKAPEGYALLSTGIEFQVQQGSWNDNRAKLSIDQHTQIRNKKVTIPQTGGIGTLVFTVVGLSAMAFAFIAMKKRQSEEA
ncbi:TPA: isopeptide-forming domain-containing fimbrial protein [Streptococcus suis]|nr:isopeptide-forming domain-containing fimbrial protein [Streptococcus suis]HEM6355803.1 isopeptide-forming domain-containing fimbrial protein [Streptococcus suis]HEM6379861.1 isopeptide-forming domain-containing fimbrial protein [Streptococcus suis]HEM6409292.1 isopeptide-forming domain-containing fimbrial protein [Streptococcus suis]